MLAHFITFPESEAKKVPTAFQIIAMKVAEGTGSGGHTRGAFRLSLSTTSVVIESVLG